MRRFGPDGGLAVVLSAVLLSGAVAAAVSAATVRLAADRSPRIASVRLGEIATGYAVKAAGDGASAETAAAGARAWAFALETALVRVADRHGTVLLPARAVAAGAPDLTAQVESALAEALGAGPGRPKAANP